VDRPHVFQRVDLSAARSNDRLWNRCRYRLARALGKLQLTVYRKTVATEGELRPWNAAFHRF